MYTLAPEALHAREGEEGEVLRLFDTAGQTLSLADRQRQREQQRRPAFCTFSPAPQASPTLPWMMMSPSFIVSPTASCALPNTSSVEPLSSVRRCTD